jgi:ubiquinone/menaquinone biosynthesis C-methylase UbiE
LSNLIRSLLSSTTSMPLKPEESRSFDRIADLYEQSRFVPPEILRQAAQLVKQDSPTAFSSYFLDIGTGTGRFARHLAAEGASVVGIDISSAMLKIAGSANSSLSLLKADARKMPFHSEAFSGGMVVHLLHLISDWKQVVREIRRVLLPSAPLYFASESGRHFPCRDLYFQIASQKGHTRPNIGAQTVREILDYFEETGASVRQIDNGGLTWEAKIEVEELVNMLERNPFSHLWHISEAEHREIIQELRKCIRQRYTALDRTESAPASLGLWRITWE